jgi:hypothetical protein
MAFPALDLSLAKATPWEQSELCRADHYHTTCFSPHTRRRTRPSNKVRCRSLLSFSFELRSTSLTTPTEAAIDANAPLEDEDAANGPIDSEEELAAVQAGLANWNPQPLVPPLVQIPIERQYMRQRLYEQLHNATNGFTVNIFKVVGYGTQKLPPGHQGNEGEGDADGEVDMGAQGLGIGIAGVAARKASGFNMTLPPQRRPSNASQR